MLTQVLASVPLVMRQLPFHYDYKKLFKKKFSTYMLNIFL